MGFELKIGQRFRVPSAVAQKYEERFGHFSFVVEITGLEPRSGAPWWPPHADLTFKLITPTRADALWYECHCLSIGHDRYGAPDMNYSPNLITGEGEWYLPDLFRWQHWFVWLLWHGVVEEVQ